MTHTPGPWHTSARSDAYQSEITQERTGKTVAVTYTSNDADARLIAKAPEMLEALRACVGHHSRDCARDNCPRCAAGNLINEIEGE